MFDYTMTVTSCGRHYFLRRMLESFVKYADVMPKAIIITEDAPVEPPDWINSEPQFRDLPKIWLPNRPKLGQIASIDKAYANVHTEYIFAVEDDWGFLETGFLEESHKILEAYPMVSQCNLRGHNWLHPSVDDPRFPFKIAQPGFCGVWGGLSWNPALRRLSDYKKNFGTFTEWLPKMPQEFNVSNVLREAYFSKTMVDRGYIIAALKEYVWDMAGSGTGSRNHCPE